MDLCYLLRGYQLSQSAMLVYGVLEGLSRASAVRGKDYTYISRKAIGERIGRSERTAQRAVKELERAGLIVVKRMGRTLNDRIFVFPPRPQLPQEEKESKVRAADYSIYGAATAQTAPAPSCPAASMAGQEPSKMAGHSNYFQKMSNKGIDKSINPGETMKKGRPTPKRVRVNKAEREKIVKKYRDFFRKSLKLEENQRALVYLDNDDEIVALDKVIDFMANTMASKAKIAVNGTLLTPQQWFDVTKNITDSNVINLLYKIQKYKARNPQAYLLSALYNEGLQGLLQKPFYDDKCAGIVL